MGTPIKVGRRVVKDGFLFRNRRRITHTESLAASLRWVEGCNWDLSLFSSPQRAPAVPTPSGALYVLIENCKLIIANWSDSDLVPTPSGAF